VFNLLYKIFTYSIYFGPRLGKLFELGIVRCFQLIPDSCFTQYLDYASFPLEIKNIIQATICLGFTVAATPRSKRKSSMAPFSFAQISPHVRSLSGFWSSFNENEGKCSILSILHWYHNLQQHIFLHYTTILRHFRVFAYILRKYGYSRNDVRSQLLLLSGISRS